MPGTKHFIWISLHDKSMLKVLLTPLILQWENHNTESLSDL